MYWLALNRFEMDETEATTVAFLALAVSQLIHVFNMRRRLEPLARSSVTANPYVWGAIVVSLALLAAACLLPALASVLELAPPTWLQIQLVLAGSVAPLVLGQIWLALTRGAED